MNRASSYPFTIVGCGATNPWAFKPSFEIMAILKAPLLPVESSNSLLSVVVLSGFDYNIC
jgi:hypothetical protein